MNQKLRLVRQDQENGSNRHTRRRRPTDTRLATTHAKTGANISPASPTARKAARHSSFSAT
jgi:hypothetical protein